MHSLHLYQLTYINSAHCHIVTWKVSLGKLSLLTLFSVYVITNTTLISLTNYKTAKPMSKWYFSIPMDKHVDSTIVLFFRFLEHIVLKRRTIFYFLTLLFRLIKLTVSKKRKESVVSWFKENSEKSNFLNPCTVITLDNFDLLLFSLFKMEY